MKPWKKASPICRTNPREPGSATSASAHSATPGGVAQTRVRSPAGAVGTVAGGQGCPSGVCAAGQADGQGTAATFRNPAAVAVDALGSVYVADTGNYLVRKISPNGAVATLAGGFGCPGGVCAAGLADGVGLLAGLSAFTGLAVDQQANLYLADTGNDVVRVIYSIPFGLGLCAAGAYRLSGAATSAAACTACAAGSYNSQPGASACTSCAAGGYGSVAASTTSAVCTSCATGTYAGLPGSSSCAHPPPGTYYAAGNASAAYVTTLAGGAAGAASQHADGASVAATFLRPGGVDVGPGSLVYVADTGNNLVRTISLTGTVATLAGGRGCASTCSAYALAGGCTCGAADGLATAARFCLCEGGPPQPQTQ
jgi:hypothetical protein